MGDTGPRSATDAISLTDVLSALAVDVYPDEKLRLTDVPSYTDIIIVETGDSLSAFRVAAHRLITGVFGDTLTLVYVTQGTYNPTTGETAPTTETLDVKGLIEWRGKREPGLIATDDAMVSIPALGIAPPEVKDQVIIDGTTYEVSKVKRSYAGPQTAIYQIEIKR